MKFISYLKISKNTKQKITNIGLVIISVSISLLFIEAVLRASKPYALTSRLLLPQNIDTRFQTSEFDTRVRTNNIGLREEHEFLTNNDETYRIAVIGDSFTFGWGVNNNETFPAKLESLYRESGQDHVEVINFGRPGENLEGYLRAFSLHAKRLEPDLIIVAFNPSNDCSSYPPDITNTGEIRRYADKATEKGLRPWKKTNFYLGRIVTTRIVKPLKVKIRTSLKNPFSRQTIVRDPINGDENPLSPKKIRQILKNKPKAMARYKQLVTSGWVARGLRWDVAPWLVLGAISQPNSLKKFLLLDSQRSPAHRFQWRICMEVLKNFRNLVKKLNHRFVVVILATPAQTSPQFIENRKSLGINIPKIALTDTRVNSRIMVFCQKHEIRCIDTLGEIRDLSHISKSQFFVIDGHPTAQTHSNFASIIKRELGFLYKKR